jgi:hypothetical protein
MKLGGTLAALGSLLGATVVQPAHAEFVVIFNQSGPGVVATGTGAIDTADLTLGEVDQTVAGAGMVPELAVLLITPGAESNATQWLFSGGPAAFGSGGASFASAQSGDSFAFSPDLPGQFQILLPGDYVSGAPLTNTETWSNATYSSLGLVLGSSFLWAWGAGADYDSFEIIVPEPGSMGLLAVGLIALTSRHGRRRTRQDAAASSGSASGFGPLSSPLAPSSRSTSSITAMSAASP